MERETLYQFFSGEAAPEQEQQVLDWLDAEPAHRQEMLAERRLFDAMLLHAGQEHSRRFYLFDKIRLPRRIREVAKYAAVVAVCVALGGAYRVYLNRRMCAENTIAVPAGQRVDVVLSDGTKVCMNALSELKYPAYFGGKSRKVQLTGEAFFDVAHDASHPFVVETFAGDVEVHGTKFDVEAHPETKEFSTSLVEGKVRVLDRSNAGNSIELQPNQRVDVRDGHFVVGTIPEGEKFLWREGLIGFRDASFMALIADFEQYYGVKICVPEKKAFLQNHFTGKIRISEGLDHALWILQRSVDFSYTRNEMKDTITIR